MPLTLPPPKLARAALARLVQRPEEDLQVQVLWTLLWPQPTRIVLAREPQGQRWRWLARRCQLDPAVVEALLTELLTQPELVVVTPHHDEWGRKLGDWLYAAEPLRAAFFAELAKPPPPRPARGMRPGKTSAVEMEQRHLEHLGQQRLPGLWRAA